MDPAANLYPETWEEYSVYDYRHQPCNYISSQRHHRKREVSFYSDFESPLPKSCKPSEPSSSEAANSCGQLSLPDYEDNREKEMPAHGAGNSDWDPSSVLLNLSFLEQKTHQLQDLVKLIVSSEASAAQQQQLVTADVTSIIVQLISAAGRLLPSVKNSLLTNPVIGQLQSTSGVGFTPSNSGHKPQSHTDLMDGWEPEQKYAGKPCVSVTNVEEHILKNEEDAGEGGNLPPGSYEVLQLEKEEILAPHAHFCQICGKGFKRDANLRMHMRGHGDEYKTVAALSKPSKEPVLPKRYSCPYPGCKHNKDHINFQPLKTMLCVKNHYKRTHCDKNYTCSRCNRKMFSVLADLKTHEKHCGSGMWVCSCGTTFSRKDKLFGHVALFQGHTPAIPVEESKKLCGTVNGRENDEATKIGGLEFKFSPSSSSGNGIQNVIDVKESLDDPTTFFSSLDFDSFNFYGFQDLPLPPFDISENSLAYLQAESSDYLRKTSTESDRASHM